MPSYLPQPLIQASITRFFRPASTPCLHTPSTTPSNDTLAPSVPEQSFSTSLPTQSLVHRLPAKLVSRPINLHSHARTPVLPPSNSDTAFQQFRHLDTISCTNGLTSHGPTSRTETHVVAPPAHQQPTHPSSAPQRIVGPSTNPTHDSPHVHIRMEARPLISSFEPEPQTVRQPDVQSKYRYGLTSHGPPSRTELYDSHPPL